MNHYDEEILRLNKKIKQLIWQNEQSEKLFLPQFRHECLIKRQFLLCFILGMSRTSQLEVENKRLSMKVEEMKEITSLTSSLNVKYKLQLDKETEEKDILKDVNDKLKTKLNNLSVKCNEQHQKIKVLETSLKLKTVVKPPLPAVRAMSGISNVAVANVSHNSALFDLQKRYDELDAEHQEALNVIDELEFELGDVIAENGPKPTFNSNRNQEI